MRTVCFIAALVFLAGCDGSLLEGDQGRFKSACVEAMKKRLKAPITFEMIKTSASQRKIAHQPVKDLRTELSALDESDQSSEARLKEARLRSDLAAARGGAEYRATEMSLLMEYEAQNSMGIPLRRHVECTAEGGPNGEFDKDDAWRVKIDGETHTEWLTSQLSGP